MQSNSFFGSERSKERDAHVLILGQVGRGRKTAGLAHWAAGQGIELPEGSKPEQYGSLSWQEAHAILRELKLLPVEAEAPKIVVGHVVEGSPWKPIEEWAALAGLTFPEGFTPKPGLYSYQEAQSVFRWERMIPEAEAAR